MQTRTEASALTSSGAQHDEPTLEELVNEYMLVYSGRDPAIGSRLERWVAMLGDRRAAAITDDDVFHSLEAIAAAPAGLFSGYDVEGKPIYRSRGRKRSAGTVNRYRNALASLYRWAITKRRLPRGFVNPCRGVQRLPEAPGRVRFLSPDERRRLLDACKRSTWPRLYAVVLIALTTGARRGEICALRWRDVNLQERLAYILQSKNDEPRVLPLVPAVVAALATFHDQDAQRYKSVAERLVFHSERRPDQAFKFEGLWQEALHAAQIRGFRFHDLRHSCASYLAQRGASLLEIADVLGHKTMAMVKRYSHLSTASKAALVERVLGGIE